MTEIITIHIYPPLHGTGHHPWRYMSFYKGDELIEFTPRGWGQTVREAENALERLPLAETPKHKETDKQDTPDAQPTARGYTDA